MSQSDIETMRRMATEVLSEGRIDVIDEVIAEDMNDHSMPPGSPPGREGLKGFVTAFRQAFPDLHYEMEHEVSQGDIVVQHGYGTGTMKGDFMGMPATGKKACWSEMHILRMRDGKAVEHWSVVDMMSMLQQLGLAPTPGMEQAA
jgi:predicted ester cyclase